MWNIKSKYKIIVFIVTFISCASIPKEVVELSYTVGKDLNAIHESYKILIKKHFDGLRSQANNFLNDRWVPKYLEYFIEDGGLRESVHDSIPEEEILENVQVWAEVAIEEIDLKRSELIDPINEVEKALLDSVDTAFSRILNANAVITAHLNSIRKVKEVQNEALRALGLEKIRDNINEELIKSSERAQKALEELKKAEGIIDEANEKKKELLQKVKGDSENE